MPDRLVFCPSCGKEVPSGRFCNSCGYTLPMIDSSEPDESFHEDLTPPRAQKPIPRFEFLIDGMDALASATLLARAELEIIDDELDLLIEQIGATRQALQLKEADKAVLSDRATHLRKLFDQTKTRREELTAFGGSLPLEAILNNLEEQETKISKLEEVEGSLDKIVFKEQESEIKAKLKSLKRELKSAIKETGRWLNSLTKTRKVLVREASRLDAKHKIGDISTSAYESSKWKVERSIRVIDVGYKMLDETLELAKKR